MVHDADRDQRKDKNRVENYRATEEVLPVHRYAISVFMKNIQKEYFGIGDYSRGYSPAFELGLHFSPIHS